jgi:hypothetical protein
MPRPVPVIRSYWVRFLAGAATVWAACVGLAQTTPHGRFAANLVDRDSYRHYLDDVLYTHMGDNRGREGVEHNLCRDNVEAAFKGFGLDAQLDPFWYYGTFYNVVDDASGVAGLLELARLVSGWKSDATIRFIAFDLEEEGLIGSDAYATEHFADDIRGMVQLDMIAYRGLPPTYRAIIYGRTASNPLKYKLGDALENYGGVSITIGGQLDASDHAPFEWLGFQACLLIEEDVWSNPHYHKQTDSVDTPNYIDYDYATAMVTGTMGWLVDAAGVTPVYPLGDVNCDGSLNLGDIAPFVLALGDPDGYKVEYPICNIDRADANGDGSVNLADIEAFIDLLG